MRALRSLRKWQPTPVLLPGKSHGWRSLIGYSPWGCKELDTTEQLHFTFMNPIVPSVGRGNPALKPLQNTASKNDSFFHSFLYPIPKNEPGLLFDVYPSRSLLIDTKKLHANFLGLSHSDFYLNHFFLIQYHGQPTIVDIQIYRLLINSYIVFCAVNFPGSFDRPSAPKHCSPELHLR